MLNLRIFSGLDYTYSRYPGKYVDGQYCNTCQPGEHNISHTIDENENNWWQSDSLSNIPDFDQRMTIDLDFGQVRVYSRNLLSFIRNSFKNAE